MESEHQEKTHRICHGQVVVLILTGIAIVAGLSSPLHGGVEALGDSSALKTMAKWTFVGAIISMLWMAGEATWGRSYACPFRMRMIIETPVCRAVVSATCAAVLIGLCAVCIALSGG